LASSRAVVLRAPPGAGKTTVVPLALLDAPWLAGRTMVMLEPRRLAARAAAYRLSESFGEPVGQTIGYRMRGDSRVGSRTRVEVVTEGILTRRLQRDPTLDGVGLVIFDEFHERSLDADLGLALTRRTQLLVRDDLRILIMSATLDGAAVAAALAGAPVVASEGRLFPVDTRYREPRPTARLEASVASAVVEAIRSDDGDVLVFLPGAAEIRRTQAMLDDRDLDGAVVLPLLGALAHDAQDRALRPDPNGRRKIVLATSIAETSLTIEGVRIVVDSGLSRSPRFSPRTGMTRLETTRVSRASADQRRGRAGRLGPGTCYRLWSEYENANLLANDPPEIASADLAPLALNLATAGVTDPSELDWIDPPAPAAFNQARELLRELGAVDVAGEPTAHGRAMSTLPVHPRLAHMLLRARDLGCSPLACIVAALLSERDVLRGTAGPIDADIGYRIQALRGERDAGSLPLGAEIDRDAVRRVRSDADRLARQLEIAPAEIDGSLDRLGMLVALAYPDRVAQRRDGSRARYVMRNGRGAELTGSPSLAESMYIVAAELDDQRAESRVFLAAAIELSELLEAFGDQIETEDVVEFDDAAEAVIARRRSRLGAIILRDAPLANPDPSAISTALLGAIRRRGVGALPWTSAASALRARIAFIARHDSSWPDVSDDALAAALGIWLGPLAGDARRLSDLERVDLSAALLGLLDWTQRAKLDELAPSHIEVPSGSRIAVDYSNPEAPVLAVRIQEVFGLTQSPRLMRGRVPVTMHLLSPAHRPVQVTQDLAGFWATSYFDVRKDLRGRYPKHEWPEHPLEATPTRRVKPRKP
jgi:ATP-dependent helicase HrpB